MRAALLVLLLSGCGASGLAVANGVGLGASTAALACDWAQTRAHAANGWRQVQESNPIMGARPSPSKVDAYFIGAAALSVLAWRLTPRRYRLAIPIAITLVQARAIVRTASVSDRLPDGSLDYDPGFCATGLSAM